MDPKIWERPREPFWFLSFFHLVHVDEFANQEILYCFGRKLPSGKKVENINMEVESVLTTL